MITWSMWEPSDQSMLSRLRLNLGTPKPVLFVRQTLGCLEYWEHHCVRAHVCLEWAPFLFPHLSIIRGNAFPDKQTQEIRDRMRRTRDLIPRNKSFLN